MLSFWRVWINYLELQILPFSGFSPSSSLGQMVCLVLYAFGSALAPLLHILCTDDLVQMLLPVGAGVHQYVDNLRPLLTAQWILLFFVE